MPAPNAEPTFSDGDYDRVREIIYAKTGMRFDASKRSYVEKRVFDRMRASREPSVTQYLTRLRFDPVGELQELINALTVNETYFFREDYQLKCLTNSLLPELIKNSGRRSFRIWSLPCSTGEEAYTIALQLLEYFPGVDQYDFEIVGSDIDTRVLATAERGHYQARSLQYVPPAMRQKYFEKVSADEWRIIEGLRESVTFTRTSVVDAAQMRKLGTFDVVFCRNLLIYFDDVSRRQATENIFEALHVGGFVCLGHSESMSRISGIFKIRKFEDGIVYQKP